MELSRSPFAQRIVRLGAARSRVRSDEAPARQAPSTFDRAIEHLAHGRWTEAYDLLASLADAGDPEAARVAMLMAMRGPRLFGRSFAATSSRRRRWQAAAKARAGEPIAQ